MAFDTRGAADGRPVLYLHGTPDSRLSVHPDDEIATRLGIQVLAVDRPGIGRSDAAPEPTSLATVAYDLSTVLEWTETATLSVVAWSAGAPYAVALAALFPEAVDRVVLAAPSVPITAYDDAAVLEAAGPGRALFAEMAAEMDPADVANEVVPLLMPPSASFDAVVALLDAEADAGRADDLAAAGVEPEHLARAAFESVAGGRTGLHDEVGVQAAFPDVDLAGCTVPVSIVSGSLDEASPVEFGRWWADLLPHAEHRVVEGAGHAVVLREWESILAEAIS